MQLFATPMSYFRLFTALATFFSSVSAYCVYMPCFTKQSCNINTVSDTEMSQYPEYKLEEQNGNILSDHWPSAE
jgi:hypothetical protein